MLSAIRRSCLLLVCASRAWAEEAIPVYVDPSVLGLYEDWAAPPGMRRVWERVPCPGADILRHPTEPEAVLIAYCYADETSKTEFAVLPDELAGSELSDQVAPRWDRVRSVLQAAFNISEELPAGRDPTPAPARTLTPRGLWLRVAGGASLWVHQRPAASVLLGGGMTWQWVHRPGLPGPLSGLRSTLDLGVALRADLPHDSLQSELARFSRISAGLGMYGNLAVSSRAPMRFVVGTEGGVGFHRLAPKQEELVRWLEDQELAPALALQAGTVEAIPEWTLLVLGPAWEPRRAGGLSGELLLRWRADVVSNPQSVQDNTSFYTDWSTFTATLSLRWSPRRPSEVLAAQPTDDEPVPDDDPTAVLLDLE